MNMLQDLLRDPSRAMRDKIVGYIGKDPDQFRELVEFFLTGPYRVTQRAAWPLSYSVERHPELIKPHLRWIIKNLKTPGLPDSVKRNTLRILQFIDVPASLHCTVLCLLRVSCH